MKQNTTEHAININDWDPAQGDYIKKNAIEDEILFRRSVNRDIMIKIGLTSLYFFLLLFSFIYLS